MLNLYQRNPKGFIDFLLWFAELCMQIEWDVINIKCNVTYLNIEWFEWYLLLEILGRLTELSSVLDLF